MNQFFKVALSITIGCSAFCLPVFAETNLDNKIAFNNIDRDIVIVRVATGKAEKKTKSGNWKRIAIGSYLSTNDIIRTGKNSSILIELPENSGFVRVLPETEVKVDKVRVGVGNEGGQITEFSVSKGKVLTKVRKFNRKSSRLKVRTKGATAAVRGTSFLTSFNNISETKVLVGDGSVSVKAKGKEVLVNPKEFTQVGLGNQPKNPEIVNQKIDFSVNSIKPNNGKLSFNGTTDPDSQINLNQASFFPNTDGSFIGNVNLQEGNNDVIIKASTIDGREKQTRIKVLKLTD